jgi:small conductance mechanosensitive channel
MHPTAETAGAFELWFLDRALSFIAAVLILVAGWALAGWASRLARRGLNRIHHFDETLKPLISASVRYTILAVALTAVLQRFGVETTSFVAVLGAAGIAIGLALQGTLSNVAAGVMLLLLRPFRVGDAVQVAGQSGTVREIGLFTTILISDDLAYVSIPNAPIFGGVITNNSREPVRRINFVVAIDYTNDADVAQRIVMDILRGDERILKAPSPTTGVSALREYAIDLVVRCWVKTADTEPVQFSIQKAIKNRFWAAGISTPARRQVSASRPDEAEAASRPLQMKSR